MRKFLGAIALVTLPLASGCTEMEYSVSDVHRMMNKRGLSAIYFVEGDMAYMSTFSENGVVLITTGSRIRDPHGELSRARPNSPELASYFYNLRDSDLEVWTNSSSDVFGRPYTPVVEDYYAERARDPEVGKKIKPEHKQVQMEIVQGSGKALDGIHFLTGN